MIRYLMGLLCIFSNATYAAHDISQDELKRQIRDWSEQIEYRLFSYTQREANYYAWRDTSKNMEFTQLLHDFQHVYGEITPMVCGVHEYMQEHGHVHPLDVQVYFLAMKKEVDHLIVQLNEVLMKMARLING